MSDNSVHIASQSYKKEPAVLKDNIEDIEKTIKNSSQPLLYATLRNPEPNDTFQLKYKEGNDYYSYMPWYKTRVFNPFAKHNYIISENVYLGTTWYDESGKPFTTTYKESELIKHINDKASNLSWAHFIWCKDKTPKTPVWYNYSIDLHWSNKYGNSSYATRIFLLNTDKKHNQELVESLNNKYATCEQFKKSQKTIDSINEKVEMRFSDDSVKMNRKLECLSERLKNIEFIKSRVFFLQKEIVDIETTMQDLSASQREEEIQKRDDYYDEIVYRIQDYDAFCWDKKDDIDLNYDDYPNKFYKKDIIDENTREKLIQEILNYKK